MVADITAGKLDLVAVWKLDRLGRSLQHLVRMMELFRKHDIEFVSLRDAAFDTTASGKLVFGIMAAVAAFESDMISERTAAGMAASKRRGGRMGRKPLDVDVDAAMELMARWNNKSRVARALGVSRATLDRRLAGREPWMDLS